MHDMKTANCLILGLTTFAMTPAFGQQPAPGATTFLQRVNEAAAAEAANPTKLTRFSLDFPGGTPKQLIAAIEKAMGKPVNAIIPPENADIQLPPLKMSNVNLAQLFDALQSASRKSEKFVTSIYFGGGYTDGPSSSYQIINTSYGFRTQGQPSDDSIWYFFKEGAPGNPPASSGTKVCRYYSLAPYLERGTTVDDITTAIQTGWKMLGDKETPTISYHKDTKLLIAVGEPNKLETIDAVLKALSPASQDKAVPASEKPASTPKPAGKSKTEN
jgi:hypothetical protein